VTVLIVRHNTVYQYSRPVALGDHWLMWRQRDSHNLRLIETNLIFSPLALIRWIYNVFSNTAAIASFSEPSAEVRTTRG
jgi:Bacterial transglutaminase-like N-terminal region